MRRVDLIAVVLVVGLAAWAVVLQFRAAEPLPPPASPTLEVGEAVPPDVVLTGLDGTPHRLGDLFGERATVLYAWSTTCPCIPWCEDELRAIAARHGPEQGFRWVAIAGEPTDTVEGIRETTEKLGSFYDVLLDPSHRLSAPMGFDRAAVVAVLDRDGYIRFRGNPSDRLKDPTRWFLNEVLDDVAAGRAPRLDHTELTYGCEFSAPVVCEDEPTLP
jgi:peroxiredoxin